MTQERRKEEEKKTPMTAYDEMFSSIIKRQHCFTRGFVLSEQNPKRLVYSVFVKLEVELKCRVRKI